MSRPPKADRFELLLLPERSERGTIKIVNGLKLVFIPVIIVLN